MAKDKLLSFSIEHMDPMGQGVSKVADKVTFIPKTLPNEKGQASIIRSAKGVHFAKVHSLEKESQERTSAKCEHYATCGGCHYLHTYYQKEIEFKQKALAKHLAKLENVPEITVHQASERYGYRNRIQLHYAGQTIGFHQAGGKNIIPIADCLLANEITRKKLLEIINSFPDCKPEMEPRKGHVEVYNFSEDEVKVHWNGHYASGGFTQVNETMHNSFRELLASYVKQEDLENQVVWDLFGGNGNIGKIFAPAEHLVVDNVDHEKTLPGIDFVNLNIFDSTDFSKLVSSRKSRPQIIILDPPRSGFKQLPELVNQVSPDHLLIVSCHPAVLGRDLVNLPAEYKMQQVHLFDFFPSTYHFETLIIYSK